MTLSSLLSLWTKLQEYTYSICKNRDSSHDYNHMKQVALQSVKIWLCDYELDHPDILPDIITVAWLHDIFDYKYDKDEQLKKQTMDFLYEICGERNTIICKIIECISFSYESKNGYAHIVNSLGDIDLIIRNIVSDADKLEALGKTGLKRCITYGAHKYLENDLMNKVLEHSNEKILKLKAHYMHTVTGHELAIKLHDEYLLYLSEYTTYGCIKE